MDSGLRASPDGKMLFMSLPSFMKLDQKEMEEYWKTYYDVTFEPIIRSYAKNYRYWTLTGDAIYPAIETKNTADEKDDTVERDMEEINLVREYIIGCSNGDPSAEYAIFRRKGFYESRVLDPNNLDDLEKISYQVLNCPIVRVNIPLGKSHNNGSNTQKKKLSKHSKIANIIYMFPILTPLQVDYIEDLFSFISSNLKSEQAKCSNLITNSLINRPVIQLTFERHHNHTVVNHDISSQNGEAQKTEIQNTNDEWYYIIFTVLLSKENNYDISNITDVIKIETGVALDEDDELEEINPDEEPLGIDEDGENAIIYQVDLFKVKVVEL